MGTMRDRSTRKCVRRRSYGRLLDLAPLAVLTILPLSCVDVRPDSSEQGSGESSAAIRVTSDRALPSLGPVAAIGNNASGRLVTPRWTPGGERLIASGFGGRGLFVVDLDGGHVTMLHHEVSAPKRIAFIDGGRAIALPRGESAPDLRIDLISGRSTNSSHPSTARRVSLHDGEGDAEVLWESVSETIAFEPLRGRIVRIADQSEHVVASHGAWGAAVSHDGSRIAFCRGHLIDAHLEVQERGESTRDFGPGVHPTWLEDGRHLVFSAPEIGTTAEGRRMLVGAELFMLDTSSGREVQLTATEGVMEMEPTISSRNHRVAFADWLDGTLYWAELVFGRRVGEGA